MPSQNESLVRAARLELDRRKGSSSFVEEAKAELERRREEQALADKMLNLDTNTGLKDFTTRMKMSFADTPEHALQTLQRKYPEAERLPDGRLIYANADTKQLTTVDEERLSLGDLADMSGLVPEIAISTVGAIAGGGTPASIAGAGAGMSIGQGVKRTVGQLFFNNSEMLGRSAAKDMTIAGLTGALGEGAGRAIQPAGATANP